MFNAPRAPIIILGMHRSGTSLVTQLLQSLGLFVGARLDENYEAHAFSKLNTWLLESCGGRWDTPRAIEYLLDDSQGIELVCDYLRQRLRFPANLEYLGWRNMAHTRTLFQINRAWGWKDPSNTITLPLWLKLFPNARLIHIVRNGIDVASSLERRQREGFQYAQARYEKFKWLVAWRAKAGWFGESPRVMNRIEAFQLWQEYLEYANRHLAPIRERALEVRYEDFLAQPERALVTLATFCKLPVSAERVRACCHALRPERRYGFLQDSSLAAWWQRVRTEKWMMHYGYDRLSTDASEIRAPA